MSVAGVLTKIQTALASMSADDAADYYVKSWFTGEPGAIPTNSVPACAIIPVEPYGVVATFVGEDTESVPLKLRLYHLAARDGEDPETAPATLKIAAQFDKIRALLRADPTLGGYFVSVDIRGTPLLQSMNELAFRTGELIIEVKQRVLWGA